jgi:hypothetical protein
MILCVSDQSQMVLYDSISPLARHPSFTTSAEPVSWKKWESRGGCHHIIKAGKHGR